MNACKYAVMWAFRNPFGIYKNLLPSFPSHRRKKVVHFDPRPQTLLKGKARILKRGLLCLPPLPRQLPRLKAAAGTHESEPRWREKGPCSQIFQTSTALRPYFSLLTPQPHKNWPSIISSLKNWQFQWSQGFLRRRMPGHRSIFEQF